MRSLELAGRISLAIAVLGGLSLIAGVIILATFAR
jgi:hypothetical protein